MTLKTAYNYLNNNVYPDMENVHLNKQVFREIDYFKNYYHIVPKLYLSYERRAYFEKDDGDLE